MGFIIGKTCLSKFLALKDAPQKTETELDRVIREDFEDYCANSWTMIARTGLEGDLLAHKLKRNWKG